MTAASVGLEEFLRCDRARPSANLADLLELRFLRILATAAAVRLRICSLFLIICNLLSVCFEGFDYLSRRSVI